MQQTTSDIGLTDAQVIASRRKHGWNELPVASVPTRIRVLLRQFSSFLVLILIAAAAVALLSILDAVDPEIIGDVEAFQRVTYCQTKS